MYKFYDSNGNSIDNEDFINLYGEAYFFNGKKPVKYVRKSSCFVEKEIEDILKNGIHDKHDVMKIFGWKTGKISQLACKEVGGQFKYFSGWEDVGNCHVRLYNREIYMDCFCEHVVNNFDELKEWSRVCPQAVLYNLESEAPPGIGTVYLLTFLYFISGGYCPIYDQYADKALAKIDSNYEPVYKKLPSRKDNGFKDVISKYIHPYWCELFKIFGCEEYRKSRNIDRALWVYGHKKEK